MVTNQGVQLSSTHSNIPLNYVSLQKGRHQFIYQHVAIMEIGEALKSLHLFCVAFMLNVGWRLHSEAKMLTGVLGSCFFARRDYFKSAVTTQCCWFQPHSGAVLESNGGRERRERSDWSGGGDSTTYLVPQKVTSAKCVKTLVSSELGTTKFELERTRTTKVRPSANQEQLRSNWNEPGKKPHK